jgi:N-acyl-D-aspartate/D-glutamate deacylase
MSCRALSLEFDFAEPFPMERLEMFEPVSRGDIAAKKKLYADKEFRRAFRKEMSAEGSDAGPVVRLRAAWEDTVITHCPTDRGLEERGLFDAADERGTGPVDLALDLSLASDLEARFQIPLANNDEAGVTELLNDPSTLIGLSDAGAHNNQLCDACFSTHLLGFWVREKGALSIEAAVHKLTALPAEIFGLKGRGRLEQGAAADVVVFDPETVGAGKLRRVSDLPAQASRLIADAKGVGAVIVNGVVLRRDNEDAIPAGGPMPGALLRNGG